MMCTGNGYQLHGLLGTPVTPSDTNAHTLYTVSTGSHAKIAALIITPVLGISAKYTIIWNSDGTDYTINYNENLTAGLGAGLLLSGMELGSGDSIKVSSTVVNALQFALSGTETLG